MPDTLEYWYGRATPAQQRIGATWYVNAQKDAERIAEEYNIDVHIVAGILSVLSVGVRWRSCMESTSIAIWQWRMGEPITSRGAYPKVIEKAERILSDMPCDDSMPDYIGSQRALKTRAFYDCIMRPWRSDEVVIDRWMLHAAGRHTGRVGVVAYRAYAGQVREIAKREEIRPCQAQAITWVSIRRAYNGKWRKERA